MLTTKTAQWQSCAEGPKVWAILLWLFLWFHCLPSLLSVSCSLPIFTQLLVDFQPCSRPTCPLNHPNLLLLMVLLAKNLKPGSRHTAAAFSCGLLFPSSTSFARLLCQGSSRGGGLPTLPAASGGCAGGQGGPLPSSILRVAWAAWQTECDRESWVWAAEQRLQPRGKMPNFSGGRRKKTSSASGGDGAVCCCPQKHH